MEDTDKSTTLIQPELTLNPGWDMPSLSVNPEGTIPIESPLTESDLATSTTLGGFKPPTFAELMATSPELQTAVDRWSVSKLLAAKNEVEKEFQRLPETDKTFDEIGRALGLAERQPAWMDEGMTKETITMLESSEESGVAPLHFDKDYTPSTLPNMSDEDRIRVGRAAIMGAIPFGAPINAGLAAAESTSGGVMDKLAAGEQGAGRYMITHPFTFGMDTLMVIPPAGAMVFSAAAKVARGMSRASGLSKTIEGTSFGKVFYPPLNEFTLQNKLEYDELVTAIRGRTPLTHMTPEIHDSVVRFAKTGDKAATNTFVDEIVGKLKKVEDELSGELLAKQDALIKKHYPAGWVGNVEQAEKNMDWVMSAKPKTNWSQGKDNTLEQIYRAVVDYLRPLQKFQDELTNAGKPIPPEFDIYNQFLIGNSRIANITAEARESVIAPVVKVLKEKQVDLDDLHDYLAASQEIAMNTNKAPGAKQIHRGFKSVEDAHATIEALKQKGAYDTIHEMRDLLYSINKAKLDVLIDAGNPMGGLFSKKTIDSWIKKFTDNWVPVRGFIEDEMRIAKEGEGLGFVKRLEPARDKFGMPVKGRLDYGKNPFVQMCKDFEDAVVAAELNRLKQNFLGLVREYPNEAVWKIKPIFSKSGEVTEHLDPFTRRLPEWMRKLSKDGKGRLTNDVIVYEHGKPVHVWVKDSVFGTAANGLGPTSMASMIGVMGVGAQWLNGLIRASATMNRGLSGLYTSASPGFMLKNLARDAQEALITTTAAENVSLAGKILARAPKEFLSYYRRNADDIAKMARFKDAGGETSFVGRPTLEEYYLQLKRHISNPLADTTTMEKTAGKVQYLNKAIENMWRKSAFDVALEEGYTVEQAAQLAKGITINFDRHGQLGYFLNAHTIFANAGIQGADKFLRIVASPAGQDIAAGIVGGAYSLAELNRYVGGVDKDGVPYYDKIGDVRERNTVFMTGNKGGYVKVPSPYGFGFLAHLGYTLNDLQHYLEQKESGRITIRRTPAEMMVGLGKSFMTNFNPITGNNYDLVNILPSWLQVGARAFTNQSNFSDAPIYAESTKLNLGIPRAEMGFSNTGEGYKYLSREIGKFGAGLVAEPGIEVDQFTKPPTGFDIPPEAIRSLVQGYGGGPVTFMTKLLSTIGGIYKKDVDMAQVPFLSDLYNPGDYTRDTNETFSKNLESIRVNATNYNYRKKHDTKGNDNAYTDKQYTLIGLVKSLDNIERDIAGYRLEMEDDPSKETEYKEAIKQLKMEYNKVYSDLVHTQ